jgi:hypothetical protein
MEIKQIHCKTHHKQLAAIAFVLPLPKEVSDLEAPQTIVKNNSLWASPPETL